MIPERDRDVLYARRVRHSKSVTNWRRQTRLHLLFKTFLRCPADVRFADKRLKHVSQTSSSPTLTKDVFVTKTYGSLGRRYFFCGSFMFFLSCVCYVFVRVCLYVPCGHLLGKGWPLGSRLWCVTVYLLLSHWYPGSGVILDCIDSWSLHPYLLWELLFCDSSSRYRGLVRSVRLWYSLIIKLIFLEVRSSQ